MASIELQGISKRFGETEVIANLDLAIGHGEFVVIIGPSGCGKSTLLRMIAGLEDVSDGRILIDGRLVNDVPAKARGAAMVFQSYALYPHMTVAENMAFSLKLSRMKKPEIDAAVAATADSLKLDELLDRYPRQLSGGQRQRVAIGRAIVRRPQVFLFDEPLSNLDAALRSQTRFEIAQLHRNIGGTSVYVTHDQVEAMTLADRIVVLNHGRIEQVAAPTDIYANPRNRFVAEFIGTPRINTLPGKLHVNGESAAAHVTVCGMDVHVEMGQPLASQDVVVGVRAEHLGLADGTAVQQLAGTLLFLERLGESTLLHVAMPDESIIICRDYRNVAISPGHPVALAVDWSHAIIFDQNGLALPARCATGIAGGP